MSPYRTHRSLLTVGLPAMILLLGIPGAARAQDEKGTVTLPSGNMASAAEMMKLRGIWNVVGCCGWSGTWYRRPNTNVFDTKWKHTNGTPVSFTVEMTSWNKTTNLITLYQADNKGTYRAYLENGSNSMVRGTTSFYPAGATWSAVAVAVDAGGDEKGRVTVPR